MNTTPSPTPSLPLETLLAERVWVRSLARSLVRDEHRADDLEQQTLLAALEHPPAHGRSPRGWLATVMRRAAGRERRGDWRRDRRQAVAVGPDAAPATADVVAQAEWHGRVVQAVLALDEPYRTTLLLRFFEDLAPREVAARMNAPVETVRSRVQRGLAKLREAFDVQHGDDRRAWAFPLIRLATGGRGGPGTGPGVAGWDVAGTAVAAAPGLGAWWATWGLGARAAFATAVGALFVGAAVGLGWIRGNDDRVDARSPSVAEGRAPGRPDEAPDAPRLAARPNEARAVASADDAGSAEPIDPARAATITGRVTRASDGGPVANARVVAMRTDPDIGPDPVPVEVESDDRGSFTVKALAAGEYLVYATTADGLVTSGLAKCRPYSYMPCSVRVEASGTATAHLVQEPGVAVDGNVFVPDGGPARGAVVVARAQASGSLPDWAPCWRATCDAEGRFRFAGLLRGTIHTLEATSDGLPTCEVDVDTGASGALHPELRFERPWSVEVRGIDAASGAVVPGLRVWARVSWTTDGPETAFASASGAPLRVGPFPPRTVHLEIVGSAYLQQGLDVAPPLEGAGPVPLTVRLVRGTRDEPAVPTSSALVRRRVRVAGPDGAQVERVGFLLVVHRPTGTGTSVSEGLVPGEFDLPVAGGVDRWLEVHHPRRAQGVAVAAGHVRVEIPSGDGPIDVRLPAERTISGSVVGPSGAAEPGVLVRAIPAWRPSDPPLLRVLSVAEARTGSDGAFLLRGLADGSYDFLIDGPDDLEPIGPVRSVPGGASLEIRLKSR